MSHLRCPPPDIWKLTENKSAKTQFLLLLAWSITVVAMTKISLIFLFYSEECTFWFMHWLIGFGFTDKSGYFFFGNSLRRFFAWLAKRNWFTNQYQLYNFIISKVFELFKAFTNFHRDYSNLCNRVDLRRKVRLKHAAK